VENKKPFEAIENFVGELIRNGIQRKKPILNVWNGKQIKAGREVGFPASRKAAGKGLKK